MSPLSFCVTFLCFNDTTSRIGSLQQHFPFLQFCSLCTSAPIFLIESKTVKSQAYIYLLSSYVCNYHLCFGLELISLINELSIHHIYLVWEYQNLHYQLSLGNETVHSLSHNGWKSAFQFICFRLMQTNAAYCCCVYDSLRPAAAVLNRLLSTHICMDSSHIRWLI